MRDCNFCKDRNIPPRDKQHSDDKCPFASKEQIETLLIARVERRARAARAQAAAAEQRKLLKQLLNTKVKTKGSVARLTQSSLDDNDFAPVCIFDEDRGALVLRSHGATASGAMRTSRQGVS